MFICAVKLETLTCGMFYLLKVPAPKRSSFSTKLTFFPFIQENR